MATARLGDRDVPLTGENGIDLDKVKVSQNFQSWCKEISSTKRFTVKKIHIQSVDMFGSRVGFMKFKADIVDNENGGNFVPGIVFMRGGAVAVLVVLNCNGEKYTILTIQPRVPIGCFAFAEIPAGMLDESGNFAGVAAKELKEETGISIKESELVDLTDKLGKDMNQPHKGVYPSPGGCDEFLRLYCCHKNITPEKLQSLEGQLTGNLKEGEMITLKVVKLDDLWKATVDVKTLCSLYLYEKYMKEKDAPPNRKKSRFMSVFGHR